MRNLGESLNPPLNSRVRPDQCNCINIIACADDNEDYDEDGALSRRIFITQNDDVIWSIHSKTLQLYI